MEHETCSEAAIMSSHDRGRDTINDSHELECKDGFEGWQAARIVGRYHFLEDCAPYGAKIAPCTPPPAH